MQYETFSPVHLLVIKPNNWIQPVFMKTDPFIAPLAKAKTVLAAGLFGYTETSPKTAYNEHIDAQRFVALYGELAPEKLLSNER